MFLTRNDVLNQLIELYNCLDFANSHNFMDDTKSARELHCPIVRSFLFNEIEKFSKVIIEDLLAIELFDFEFASKVYEFEKTLFEKRIKNAIKKYLGKFEYEKILQIVGNFKYDLQAIMGYEAIFEQIHDESKDTKKSYDLSQKLQEMIDTPLFSQQTTEKQTRLTKMAKCLPIYPHHLGDTTKLLITNIGNKAHLNVEMVRENSSTVGFPTLIFDSKQLNWTVHHFRDENENLYEFKSPQGQLLCWVKPFSKFLGRIVPAETILMDRTMAKNTKWKIECLDQLGDPSKGFTIKASDCNIFLSGARTGEFSVVVDVLKELDLEQSERCAWTFHRIEYE
ncbi:uncharacterized protein LOC129946879 [Eupeodes corollae]|uniref:uncharacterized protein LOC129946879 n=1 Tax=Eupeodes corollae TaxID=290404 RepID=UPI00248FA0E1|nr:uncharacterized protein LOC129946879 [Eupeodes corollae]XP_055913221.1 uncharacterized protein LOC129946879 [Eupeodes corollae]XP_055913222.1 uncharacterized protein LOC129946879 [Eupeodes corollae]